MDAILGALKSKTMWFALATVVLGTVVDPVQAWIVAHPGFASSLIGVVFGFLRTFTTQSLTEKGNPPNQRMSA